MTTHTPLLPLLLACCLCSVGCVGLPTGPPTADVALTNVSESISNGSDEFRVDLTIEGNYESIELESVAIEFCDGGRTVVRRVELGDLENRFRNGTAYSPRVATVDVTLSERPAAILIRTADIHTAARVGVHGLQRNETGELVYVDQE